MQQGARFRKIFIQFLLYGFREQAAGNSLRGFRKGDKKKRTVFQKYGSFLFIAVLDDADGYSALIAEHVIHRIPDERFSALRRKQTIAVRRSGILRLVIFTDNFFFGAVTVIDIDDIFLIRVEHALDFAGAAVAFHIQPVTGEETVPAENLRIMLAVLIPGGEREALRKCQIIRAAHIAHAQKRNMRLHTAPYGERLARHYGMGRNAPALTAEEIHRCHFMCKEAFHPSISFLHKRFCGGDAFADFVLAHGFEKFPQAGTCAPAGHREAHGAHEIAELAVPLLRKGAKRRFDIRGIERIHGHHLLADSTRDSARTRAPLLRLCLLLVLRRSAEKIHGGVRNVLQKMSARLQKSDDFLKARIRLAGNVNALFSEPALHHVNEGCVILETDVLPVHPLEFLFVEGGFLRIDTVQRECGNHFLNAHHLAVSARIPAEKREEVQKRLGKVAQVAEIADGRGALALGKLAPARGEDHRKVAPYRSLPAERFVQKNMLGRGADPFVAAEHVRRPHQMIVHDACEMVRGESVALDEHEIVEDFVLVFDVPADLVFESGHTRERNLEADDGLLARGDALLRFFARNVAAMAVIARHGDAGLLLFLADFLQTFLGAEAVIGITRIQEFLDLLMVNVEAGALEIRTDAAFAAGAFVPLESEPLEVAHQVLERGFVIALAVGVLDAQVKSAARRLRKEVVVKSGARAAHMEVTCGARSETDADGTIFISHCGILELKVLPGYLPVFIKHRKYDIFWHRVRPPLRVIAGKAKQSSDIPGLQSLRGGTPKQSSDTPLMNYSFIISTISPWRKARNALSAIPSSLRARARSFGGASSFSKVIPNVPQCIANDSLQPTVLWSCTA